MPQACQEQEICACKASPRASYSLGQLSCAGKKEYRGRKRERFEHESYIATVSDAMATEGSFDKAHNSPINRAGMSVLGLNALALKSSIKVGAIFLEVWRRDSEGPYNFMANTIQ